MAERNDDVWAAIRYRRSQAAALMLLSALIATCAALAPLYTRALEQGLLRDAVFAAEPADTALTVKATRTPTSPDLALSRLAQVVPAEVRALHEPGIGMYNGQVLFEVFPKRPSAPLDLVYRDGMCQHVRITEGTCPTARGEIAVTAAEAAFWKWGPGERFTVTERDAANGAAPQRLRVVGVYEQLPDDAYWMRLKLDGRSGGTLDGGDTPALDSWITAADTFAGAWGQARLTVQYPLNRALITLDDVPAAAAAITQARADSGSIDVESPMTALLGGIRDGQKQVRLVVPLLMAQLGLLAAVVLLSVAAAAVEQRRPEVALARLRGRSRDGARWLVVGELGTTVLLGLPLGLALAIGINEAARRVLLPAGVPFEFPVGVLVALAAAALVALGAVWVAAQPVLSEPISSLLRRVATARASRLPVLDLVVVALALAGLAGLVGSPDAGPLALVTPTLLSLAAGLVVAHLMVRAAAASGRAHVRGGRVGPALAAYQLARRPAVRKVLTIVTVATALAVFAANAVTVADRNREARAELEAGAPVTLLTDAVEPTRLQRALAGVDPEGTSATPVAVIRPRDVGSTPTLAVVPHGLAAVGFPARSQPSLDLASLAPPAVTPLLLSGETVTATVSSTLSPAGVEVPGGRRVAPRAELGLSVTMPDGERLSRSLGTVPLDGGRPARLSAPLLCPDGCRLDGLAFRLVSPLPTAEVSDEGSITVAGLALDGRPLDVNRPELWQPATEVAGAPDDYLRVASQTGGERLVLEVRNSGVVLRLGYADVPGLLPAILAGGVPPGGTPQQFQASGINGIPTTMTRTQQVPAVPVLGDQGVLVNYETLARLGGRIPGQASLQVWLRSDSPAQVQRVRTALSSNGINVLSTRTAAHLKQTYDRSASGWGLQLSLVTGGLALLMAALALVVVAATSWRGVARDFAALRMAGVPLPVLRRAARSEQLVVVGVGVGVGAVSGLVGGHLAMPLIPLFNRAAAVPAPDLSPAWTEVAAASLLALIFLGGTGLLTARALGRRFTLGRIRELL